MCGFFRSARHLGAGLVLILSCFMPAAAPAQIQTVWERKIGGVDNDGLRCVAATADGGSVACGYTLSEGDSCSNFLVTHFDTAGNVVWSRAHGGPGRELAYAICESGDGGYYFTGVSTSCGGGDEDLVVGRLDGAGELSWLRAYGGAADDGGCALRRLVDGSILVTGRTWSRGAGENDLFLLRLAADGDTIWTRVFGGAESEWGTGICETSDGCYGISGTTGSYSANRDLWLLKVNPAGSLVWQRSYAGNANADFGNGILAVESGGMVLVGNGDLHGADLEQIHLLRVDAAGNQVWDRRLGQGTYYDYGCSVARTEGGGFLVCGATKNTATRRNDLYLVRTNADGVVGWTQTFGDSLSDWGSCVVPAGLGEYVVCGHTESEASGLDGWVLRLRDPAAAGVPGGAPETGALELAVPNPFRAGDEIRLRLYQPADVSVAIVDVSGRQVAVLAERERVVGDWAIRWDAGSLPAGVYFCRARTGGQTVASRLVLIDGAGGRGR